MGSPAARVRMERGRGNQPTRAREWRAPRGGHSRRADRHVLHDGPGPGAARARAGAVGPQCRAAPAVAASARSRQSRSTRHSRGGTTLRWSARTARCSAPSGRATCRNSRARTAGPRRWRRSTAHGPRDWNRSRCPSQKLRLSPRGGWQIQAAGPQGSAGRGTGPRRAGRAPRTIRRGATADAGHAGAGRHARRVRRSALPQRLRAHACRSSAKRRRSLPPEEAMT